ncbi:unnamed protein product [Brassica oleracea var. botrytis]
MVQTSFQSVRSIASEVPHQKQDLEETRLNHSVKSSNWANPNRTGSSFHHGFSLDLLLRRVLFREPPLSSDLRCRPSFEHFSAWIDFGNSDGDIIECVPISKQPAFDHPFLKYLRHDSLILVSGGSGVTPFISVIRELIFQAQNQSTKIPDVLLVCAFKYYHDLAFLDLIFPPDISVSDISRLNLRIEAYITQEDKKPEAADDTRLLQTKWFKPQPLDSPISPVLGRNNILWLGVVILSSFVMFLLLIAIVTRYYIYPVDRNTGKIYNFSYRVLWDMFLGCVCIFISSSAVFLWRKKVNKEGDKESKKQVQSVDFQTPTSSPGSWFCSHDRELESVPYQSIVQATSVHFGSKPNLKKILFEAEGSEDVGVMVCGPRKMRHEVARICSSGLAKNLHFEAISFNW